MRRQYWFHQYFSYLFHPTNFLAMTELIHLFQYHSLGHKTYLGSTLWSVVNECLVKLEYFPTVSLLFRAIYLLQFAVLDPRAHLLPHQILTLASTTALHMLHQLQQLLVIFQLPSSQLLWFIDRFHYLFFSYAQTSVRLQQLCSHPSKLQRIWKHPLLWPQLLQKNFSKNLRYL